MLNLAIYFYIYWSARSSPNQTPTALLTTALIWLDYHLTERISNLDSLLEVTVTPLHVPTHNRVQHEIYTKKGTSNLLNTARL